LFDVRGQNGFNQNHAPAISDQFIVTAIIISNIVFAALHKIADSKGLFLRSAPRSIP
jgi:hypothetical protein